MCVCIILKQNVWRKKIFEKSSNNKQLAGSRNYENESYSLIFQRKKNRFLFNHRRVGTEFGNTKSFDN